MTYRTDADILQIIATQFGEEPSINVVIAKRLCVLPHAQGLEPLPVIQADERRLFNAFYNVIDNAIPEVPPGGSVTVRGQVDVEANELVISIADTGKGMPPAVRDALFTTQVVSRKAGGTGLGTKIVKDVVDAHKGSISVESEVGVGTTVHIHLPINSGR